MKEQARVTSKISPDQSTTDRVWETLQETPEESEFKKIMNEGSEDEVIEHLNLLNNKESFHVLWKECFLSLLDKLNITTRKKLVDLDQQCSWFFKIFNRLDDEVVERLLSLGRDQNQKEDIAIKILINLKSFRRINTQPLLECYDISKAVYDENSDKREIATIIIWNLRRYIF